MLTMQLIAKRIFMKNVYCLLPACLLVCVCKCVCVSVCVFVYFTVMWYVIDIFVDCWCTSCMCGVVGSEQSDRWTIEHFNKFVFCWWFCLHTCDHYNKYAGVSSFVQWFSMRRVKNTREILIIHHPIQYNQNVSICLNIDIRFGYDSIRFLQTKYIQRDIQLYSSVDIA